MKHAFLGQKFAIDSQEPYYQDPLLDPFVHSPLNTNYVKNERNTTQRNGLFEKEEQHHNSKCRAGLKHFVKGDASQGSSE